MTRIFAIAILMLAWSACSAQTVTLYFDQNYHGEPFTTSRDVARLPAPIYGNASSFKIVNANDKWTILWESENFNTGDDQWWIQGSREILLMNLPRQHGGSWNDLVKAVSFSDTPPPWDDSDNRSICIFNSGCAQHGQRLVVSNPVILNPRPEHPGWFVRVCTGSNHPDLQGINIDLGRHNPGDADRFRWLRNGPGQPTWKKGQPATFDLPMNFLYVRDIWLRAEAVPLDKQVSMCAGYYDHTTWQYSFERAEHHQPDQNDRRNCEC